jgi:Zn-dependent protease
VVGVDDKDPLGRLSADPDWQRRMRRTEREFSSRRRAHERRRRLSSARGRLPRVSWIFLALLAATVVCAVVLWLDVAPPKPFVFVFVLAGWLVTLCLHEFAHAWVAHRSGDDSIAERGYLELNPLKYGHPILTFVLPLAMLAYGGLPLPGGAVLVHQHRLRSRFRASLVSLAGPATNAVLAVVLLAVVATLGPDWITGTHEPRAPFWAALTFLAFLQVATVVLNLIPAPGLDGYGALEPWLPEGVRRSLAPLHPFGILIVLALLTMPPLRDAFSDVVQWPVDATDAPVNGVYFGDQLFRFWQAWF